MKLFYLIIFFWLCIIANTLGQEVNKKTQENKSPKIEIKATSRSQMAVIRDNYHQRRDLRYLKMNKKMRMNKKKMISYHNSQLKQAPLKNRESIKRQNTTVQKRRNALQQRRLERQKQLRNRTR
ncbi:hypothetical protein [Plebeiibacterium sediminum]|uniref:Uncharacterized protein n=1 Tax=Plebeiibacterium sediminum TaxID=2992112 RepID=A0AAE3M1H6_9BACT|nr:hypothetical protein [Plebeiobacterium sediminum]MCW3785020.1 hypothetical protein [Plebeiobacterium sediminum]